jgi:probable rRNA maturation factor
MTHDRNQAMDDASRAGAAHVEVSDPERRLSAGDASWLAQTADGALVTLGASGEVRVRVVGDAAMAAAHQRYAGVAGTTDVLTFDLAGDPSKLDVDILVCMDEAARQAARRGHETRTELLLYIVHGILHCLGHDDHDEAAAARMHAEEDRLLSAVGVGAVYARSEAGAGPSGGGS